MPLSLAGRCGSAILRLSADCACFMASSLCRNSGLPRGAHGLSARRWISLPVPGCQMRTITSGSAAAPVGVMLPPRAVFHRAWAPRWMLLPRQAGSPQ